MSYHEKDNFTDVAEILARDPQPAKNGAGEHVGEGQVQNSNGDIITLGKLDRITKEA